MIWHDHLSILWNSATQQWMRTLKCGIQGWEDRTWADMFIRLRGKYNKGLSKYYRNALPGDSPELMPLDSHLFNDIKDGVSRNMAFSFFLADDDPDKYSLRTPKHAFAAIQRTIMKGYPGAYQIRQNIERIPETLNRIISSKGVYISDSSRKGVRADAERESKLISVDPAVMEKFIAGIDKMTKGGGVLFTDSTLPLVASTMCCGVLWVPVLCASTLPS